MLLQSTLGKNKNKSHKLINLALAVEQGMKLILMVSFNCTHWKLTQKVIYLFIVMFIFLDLYVSINMV